MSVALHTRAEYTVLDPLEAHDPYLLHSSVMATSMQLSFADVEALEEPAPRTSSPEVDATRSVSRSADQAALAALEAALVDARASEDDRPPLVVLASCLGQLGGSSVSAPPAA